MISHVQSLIISGVRRYRPNPKLVRAIDIMFTLHAEHEMNCSTAAARHLASSGVDVYTAVGGAGACEPDAIKPMRAEHALRHALLHLCCSLMSVCSLQAPTLYFWMLMQAELPLAAVPPPIYHQYTIRLHCTLLMELYMVPFRERQCHVCRTTLKIVIQRLTPKDVSGRC